MRFMLLTIILLFAMNSFSVGYVNLPRAVYNVDHGSSRMTFSRRNLENNMDQQTDPEVKELFNDFFQVLFVEQEPLRAFSSFTSFDRRDAIDEKAIGKSDYFRELPKDLRVGERNRYRANVWEYEFGDRYLGLGLFPLREDGLPVVAKNFSELVNHSFNRSNTSNADLDFDNANGEQIRKKLKKLDRFVKILRSLIAERIDRKLYKSNIDRIRQSNTIETRVVKGRTYYIYSLIKMDPSFFFVATRKDGKLTIIQMGDDV